MKDYQSMTVGEIVADNFDNAAIFDKYGIDFCCHGSDSLPEASRKAEANMDEVIKDIESKTSGTPESIDFKSWPIDLLVDYILKIHHRNIRSHGPEIMKLLEKVCNVHGEHHPELFEVRELFQSSLYDLGNHLDKEELVLFPYIYDMFKTQEEHKQLPDFHCGSVEAPISVMMAEHDAEGERYRHIDMLTHGYSTPEDACNSYRLVLEKLKAFEAALHQHIHLENNIVFPRAIQLEEKLRG
ncbi:iron-sulfur cluster repair di-iron protein [Bacteroides oleiciplenus]|uniref:iron-sulfur cluster repair di-iron protein n=1 Tax=Bacteroides oleiciplenus TaxID=626931 RepID=UPI0026DD4C4A|nr:iron-sulfur cluster repair di-iron protein [Bacteroides oleiciplenus]